MASDGFDRGDCHRAVFLTARELRELDADPVLDAADYWERGRS